jgi:hypothetical protein
MVGSLANAPVAAQLTVVRAGSPVQYLDLDLFGACF